MSKGFIIGTWPYPNCGNKSLHLMLEFEGAGSQEGKIDV